MAMVILSKNVERKPLSLPPPVIFSPRPTYTKLGTANAFPGMPAPVMLPPTPPPPPYIPDRPLPSPPARTDSVNVLGDVIQQGIPVSGVKAGEQGSEHETGSSGENGSEQNEPLSLAQLRQAMKGLPSRQRPAAYYDFVYDDSDTRENEINEFYNYQDNPFIQEGRVLFESSFAGEWGTANTDDRSAYIEILLEYLELKNPEERYGAAKKLLYISQGVFGENSTKSSQMEAIVENNVLLFRLGALAYFHRALRVVSATLDLISRSTDLNWPSNDRQIAMDMANVETSIYLSLLFMIVECNQSNPVFIRELEEAEVEPPFTAYLFNLVAQLAEGNRKHYPVKKLLLLLWKVLLTTIGGEDRLERLKNASRVAEGLPEIHGQSSYTKTTPQDYFHYQALAAHRYPAYMTPEKLDAFPPSIIMSEPLPAGIRRQMLVMGTVQPFMDQDSHLPTALKESLEIFKRYVYVGLSTVQVAKEKAAMEQTESLVGPSHESSHESIPRSLEDDNGPAEFVEQSSLEESDEDALERIDTLYRQLLPHMATHVGMLVRLLYYVNLGNSISPSPTSANASDAGDGKQQQNGIPSPESNVPLDQITPQQRQETMDRVDLNRHKEVVTKAVSGILLVLLKAFKCHNVFKFEYVSQLLVDNNCAILILKMLSMWFQNPNAVPGTPQADAAKGTANGASWGTGDSGPGGSGGAGNAGSSSAAAGQGIAAGWLKVRDEPTELKETQPMMQGLSSDPIDEDINAEATPTNSNPTNPTVLETSKLLPTDTQSTTSNDTDSAPLASISPPPFVPPIATRRDSTTNPTPINSCFRNFFTSINLLRILQKLTKGKTHRLLALVQWKGSAVLKRVIKVNSVPLQLYALKLLKGQVPYLGRKWRSTNMKVITAVYMHLRPHLKDEYLSGDVDMDVDEALAQEQQLRTLIGFHHQRLYPDLFPKQPITPPNGCTDASLRAHRPELPDHDSTDDIDLILAMSRRGSYDATNPHHAHLLRSSSFGSHDRLALDDNFMENYEEWLLHEVFEPDDPNSTHSDWSTSSTSSDFDTPSSPRTLFSATRRFDKDMLNDYYDDQDWEWEENHTGNWGTDVSEDGIPEVGEWEAYAVDEGGHRGWGWDDVPPRKGRDLDDDEYKIIIDLNNVVDEGDRSGGEDSSYGSLGSDGEDKMVCEATSSSDSDKGSEKESESAEYCWPDEAPVQTDFVDVFKDGEVKV